MLGLNKFHNYPLLYYYYNNLRRKTDINIDTTIGMVNFDADKFFATKFTLSFLVTKSNRKSRKPHNTRLSAFHFTYQSLDALHLKTEPVNFNLAGGFVWNK
jgi:hypothetical protein